MPRARANVFYSGKDLSDSAAIPFHETRHVQSIRQLEHDALILSNRLRTRRLAIDVSWIDRFFDAIRRYQTP